MKVTDIRVYVAEGMWRSSWTFVEVRTDEGLTGFGEASNYPGNGSLIVGDAVRRVKEFVVGEDPSDIGRLWHKLFRKATYLGPRGLPTAVMSAIDTALWDIKGKAVGRPVYDLLGGRFREAVRLYANGWFDGCSTPDQYAAAAVRTVASGHNALKCDPFWLAMGPYHTAYVDGQIPPDGEELGVNIVAAMREAVGPRVEILIDAHGQYNVPTAVRLARRLEPYRIGWFEEPVPPESPQALRAVREQVDVPICVGERLYTRWDFLPIFEGRLADFVMPDIAWTGGISEMLRIATMAETYHVPVTPHNAGGPLQIIAAAHAMATIPNFYRLEFATGALPHFQACLNQPIELDGDSLRLPDRPGLGFDLNTEYLRMQAVQGWDNEA